MTFMLRECFGIEYARMLSRSDVIGKVVLDPDEEETEDDCVGTREDKSQ